MKVFMLARHGGEVGIPGTIYQGRLDNLCVLGLSEALSQYINK